MKLSAAFDTRIGGRRRNEDAAAVTAAGAVLLAVVADGMGGHNHGDVASRLAVDTLVQSLQRQVTSATPRLADPFLFLQQGFEAGHQALAAFTHEQRLPESPLTTCVACLVQDGIAYWAHVGDSRLYLLRDGRVHGRTRDHSYVQQLIDRGEISPAQARQHPQRNRVSTCLGGPLPPAIEFSRKTPVQPGDVLALCTDGVWGVLSSEELAAILLPTSAITVAVAVQTALDRVDQRGGERRDNLTLAVIRCEGEPVAPVATPLPPADTTLTPEDLGATLAALRRKLQAPSD
jgi:serine/threonine protein phosphatase PrpC